MRAADIIAKKRDGGALTGEEIQFLITGYVAGDIPEYQVSAWLMAVYLKGMTFEETGLLTRVAIDSGKTIHLGALAQKIPVDKHSTGGVGDKISLPLAPLAAAMGLSIPMMSGRALGLTGGTLDKLESISGYRTALSESEFVALIEKNGYAMTGQSRDVVPADKLLYSLRDVTSTVESIPLITASILSKKFAEGALALVFDVKCGSGAFMKDYDRARALADSLVKTASSLGRKAIAFITDMNEPLGVMTGNFLEVEESVLCLEGKGPADLMELIYTQASAMALAAGRVSTEQEGDALAREKLGSGAALAKFWENVAAQGGDVDKTKRELGVRRASVMHEIRADKAGFVSSIDAERIGRAGIFLGVGRDKTSDSVSALAGFEFLKKRGDKVNVGDILCKVYAEEEKRMANALTFGVAEAFSVAAERPVVKSLILDRLAAL